MHTPTDESSSERCHSRASVDVSLSSEAADPAALIAALQVIEQENSELERQLLAKEEAIRQVRSRATKAQQLVELEEECITRRLLKRVDSAVKDNKALETRLRHTEQCNAEVAAQLEALKREKVELEKNIEAEQEFLVNRLHRQLVALSIEKSQLAQRLHAERSFFLASLEQEVQRLKAALQPVVESRAAAAALADGEAQGGTGVSSESGVSGGAVGAEAAADTAEALILQLEDQIRGLLAGVTRAAEDRLVAEQQCAQLAAALSDFQRDTVVEKAKEARLLEELDRVNADLVGGDSRTPASVSGGLVFSSRSALGSGRRGMGGGGHLRTESGSSLESTTSSIRSSSSCHSGINVSLASRDPRQVREHTARVLSTPILVPAYPAPTAAAVEGGGGTTPASSPVAIGSGRRMTIPDATAAGIASLPIT